MRRKDKLLLLLFAVGVVSLLSFHPSSPSSFSFSTNTDGSKEGGSLLPSSSIAHLHTHSHQIDDPAAAGSSSSGGASGKAHKGRHSMLQHLLHGHESQQAAETGRGSLARRGEDAAAMRGANAQLMAREDLQHQEQQEEDDDKARGAGTLEGQAARDGAAVNRTLTDAQMPRNPSASVSAPLANSSNAAPDTSPTTLTTNDITTVSTTTTTTSTTTTTNASSSVTTALTSAPSSPSTTAAAAWNPAVIAGHVSMEDDGKGTDLVMGVLTDPNSLRSIGMAVYTTWARELEATATVIFFIGSCSSEVQGFPGNMVCLDTADTYPPQRKVFLLWRFMHTRLRNRHRLFVKLDHDSYVNCPNLMKLTHLLLTEEPYAKEDVYVGLPGNGRVEERKALGLNGKFYCSGLGYILSRSTLDKIGGHLMDCLAGAVSNHSDTEMGRCIFSHTPTECRAVPNFVFRQVYYQQQGSMVYPMKLMHGGQITLKFLRMPKATHFDSVLLHPLKRAEDFYRFHKQTMSQLRPAQPALSKDSNPQSFRQATADLRKTCVNNVARQVELHGYVLPECEPPEREISPTLPSVAFIIALHDSPNESIASLVKSLDAVGITPKVVDVGMGTDGYLKALYEVFRNVTLAQARGVLIIDAGASMSCKFAERVQALMDSPRCGNHLGTFQKGGVLVLGADIVTSEALLQVEQDRAQASKSKVAQTTPGDAALCFNVAQHIRGTYAALYHRSTFGDVLGWLYSFLFAKPPRSPRPWSLDAVLPHLSERGYIVRGSYPTLFTMGSAAGAVGGAGKEDGMDGAVVSEEDESARRKWLQLAECPER